MQLLNALKENKAEFLIILAFIVIAGLNARGSMWDPAVYVGMGKYIYSSGQVGLWEPARPVMLPLWLGLFWKLGLDPFATGAFSSLLLAAAAIFFVYLITKELCDKKSAAIFSLLFAMNFALITFSNSILTDIPAMFFSLVAVYLAIRKKFLAAGALAGVAMLTKFTSLLILPAILAGIAINVGFTNKNRIAAARNFVVGLGVVTVPYFLANYMAYKNPIYPLLAGQRLIQSVVGNYTCPSSALFYLKSAVAEVPLLLILIAALFAALLTAARKPATDWKLAIVALAAAVPFAYHSLFLHCKDIRYAFAFLPYFYVLSAKALHIWRQQGRQTLKYIVAGLVAAQIILSAATLASHVAKNEPQWKLNPEFYGYLESHNVSGKVWASTPEVIGAAKVMIDELIYYPVFDNRKISEITTRLNEERGTIQYVLINTCDIPCVNYDADCPDRQKGLLDRLNKTFTTVFHAKQGECDLTVYQQRAQ